MGEEITLSGIYHKETSSLSLILPSGEEVLIPLALPFNDGERVVLRITTEIRDKLNKEDLAKAILNEILSS